MALFRQDDVKLMRGVRDYQAAEEPSLDLERNCVKQCLNLVQMINDSDGKISSQVKQLKESSSAIKLNL